MMKKVTSFSFLSILVVSILLSFTVPALAGPASGTWVDFAHIEYDGETYIDSDPLDSTINYKLNGEQGSCVSEIKGFSTTNILDTAQMGRAEFVLKEKDPVDTSSCNESDAQSITLNETDKSNDFFIWVDQDKLQGASTGSIYVRLPGEDVFVEETNNSCKNSIELTSNTTATFIDRAKEAGNVCGVDKTYSIGLGSAAENSSKPPGTGTVTGSSSSAGGPTCESEGGVFGWILCPLLGWASKAIELVEGWISNKLAVPSDYYDNEGVVGAWANVRNIAYLLLIPTLLFMVISTALGYSFVDAYTVKRALPRLFVAIIFIALSYELTTLMIDVVNAIGEGIGGLIAAPFGGSDALTLQNIFNPNSVDSGLIVVGGGLVLAGLAIGAVSIVSVGILGSYLLVAALALLSVFFLLILRQVIIIALIIVAPLAILSWIFPGNDKPWKIWWGTFSKLLYLYPILIAAIVTGRAFALIVSQAPATGGDSILRIIIVITAYIAPFFLIPTVFRYAGGAFANIAGIVNNRSKGVFDRQRKYRGERKQQNWADTKSGNRFKGGDETSRRYRANKMLAFGANQGEGGLSLRPSVRNAKVKSAMADKEFEHAMELADKTPGGKAFFQNDTLMLGGLKGEGNREQTMQFFRDQGEDEAQARLSTERALRMRSTMGADAYTVKALTALPGTGTYAVGDDVSEWHADIAKYTHGDQALQGSIIAAGKSGWRSAQRYSVSEAGFGDHFAAVKMAGEAKNKDDLIKVSHFIADKAYKAGGAQAVIAARNGAEAEVFAGAMNRDTERVDLKLETAEKEVVEAQELVRRTVDPVVKRQIQETVLEPKIRERDQARTEKLRSRAALGAIQDQIGGAKQVVSEVLGNKVYGQRVDIEVPVTEEIDTGKVDVRGEPIMKTVPKVIRVDTGRIDASGQPIIEEKIETKIITGNRVQEIQTLSTDEVYQQFKHEYSNSVIGDIESQKGTPPPTVGGGMNTPTPGGTIGN